MWINAAKMHGSACSANNKHLPPMVETLCFEELLASVDAEEWAAVLPALSRLWYLMITPSHPSIHRRDSSHPLPIDFLWLHFHRRSSVAALAGLPRPPAEVLRSVKGCPGDLASWAFDRPSLDVMWFLGGFLDPMDINKLTACTSRLRSLRISAPDFVSFARANPATVSTLCHLVLDEDVTWSDFTLISDQKGLGDSSLASACALIENNERCFRRLESIFLVCGTIATDRSHRRLLSRDDAVCFLKFMSLYFSSPALRIFRFSATDGYASCIGWDEDILHYSSRSRAPAFLAYYNELFP
ncbi:hypothetical protein B0H14DRAFT_3488949 [Mycena olivaceomarginata]|nr:hypothetical protein B0H14DRAFT_3488949 [Mycena olivaceomarginata]